jgi:hypothetical protein
MAEHPQVQELRERLDELFSGRSPTGYVQVHEPDRGALVEFFRDNDTNRVTLSFGLKDQDEQGLAAPRKLKLPRPKLEKTRFFDGRVFAHYAFRFRVDGPDEATQRALAIVTEVKHLSAGEWLWITDDPFVDQWPSPLPKPDKWPPDA